LIDDLIGRPLLANQINRDIDVMRLTTGIFAWFFAIFSADVFPNGARTSRNLK